jgi:hypothetical protein
VRLGPEKTTKKTNPKKIKYNDKQQKEMDCDEPL